MKGDTVTLISANPSPKTSRNPKGKKKNPQTQIIAGQAVTLPTAEEAIAGIAGLFGAVQIPTFVARIPGVGPAGSTINIAVSALANGLIAGAATRVVNIRMAATYAIVAGSIHIGQLISNLSGGQFGIPSVAGPRKAIGAPRALPASPRAPTPQGALIPAAVAAPKAIGASVIDVNELGDDQFFSEI